MTHYLKLLLTLGHMCASPLARSQLRSRAELGGNAPEVVWSLLKSPVFIHSMRVSVGACVEAPGYNYPASACLSELVSLRCHLSPLGSLSPAFPNRVEPIVSPGGRLDSGSLLSYLGHSRHGREHERRQPH